MIDARAAADSPRLPLLLLGDTHLGLDMPARPRVERRRRGPEMLEAFERGQLPYPLLARHPGLHVFDRPRTFSVEAGGLSVCLAGFPSARRVHGSALRGLLRDAEAFEGRADVRLLCMHQAVEGARVGAQDSRFRAGLDAPRSAAASVPFRRTPSSAFASATAPRGRPARSCLLRPFGRWLLRR